jgi:hypothetical protein
MQLWKILNKLKEAVKLSFIKPREVGLYVRDNVKISVEDTLKSFARLPF